MVQNFQNIDELHNQITICGTRVGYSHTIHIKSVLLWTYAERATHIALWTFCALATSTLIGFIITDYTPCMILSITSSILSTVVSTIINSMDFKTHQMDHKSAADSLWRIREEYTSLLVDYPILSHDQRITKRDCLLNKTDEIYRTSPATGMIAKIIAMRALKSGEQTINSEDIQRMNPNFRDE